MAAPDLSVLDLETKVRLLTGATSFTLAPEPALGSARSGCPTGPPASAD